MENNDLKAIIIDQKEELNIRKKVIEREFLENYKKYLKTGLIKVVFGIRRCGKSTLCSQLLSGEKFAYANFDDERLSSLKTEDLNRVLEIFYEIYPDFKYIFLDEVQNIYGWELFVNRLHRNGLNVVVTGSNAKLLNQELTTHLTGRHFALEMFPFSFREFLRYYDVNYDLKLLSTQDKGIIKNRFNEYIKAGGFPELLNNEVLPNLYLRYLYSDIIEKDVILRKKIKYIRTMKDIATYLLSNCSNPVSYNKIKNIFSLKSIHTAINYLSYLEESYLFFFLRRISYKNKESIVSNRKVYVVDSGIISALGSGFSQNLGKIYENIVAIELLRRKTSALSELFYWQDYQKKEVDFVVKEGHTVIKLIQVSYDLSKEDTRKREISNLIKASQEFNCNDLSIITADIEDEETIGNKKIKCIPLWKWLLE